MRKLACIAVRHFSFVGLGDRPDTDSGNVFSDIFLRTTNHPLTAESVLDLSAPIHTAGKHRWRARSCRLSALSADVSGHVRLAELFLALTCPTGPLSAQCKLAMTTTFCSARESRSSVGKFRPFAEIMVGVGHINTRHSLGVGHLVRHRAWVAAWTIALSVPSRGVSRATTFTPDSSAASQNNVRLSTGIVLRF